MLRERIFAHEQAAAGEQKTNVGGWHSETGQLEFCGMPAAGWSATCTRWPTRPPAAC